MKRALSIRVNQVCIGSAVAILLSLGLFRWVNLSGGSLSILTNPDHLSSVLGYSLALLTALGILSLFLFGQPDEDRRQVRLESFQFAVAAQMGISVALSVCMLYLSSEPLENYLAPIIKSSLIVFWLFYLLRYGYVAYIRPGTNA